MSTSFSLSNPFRASSSLSGVGFTADASQLRTLSRSLRMAPLEIRREIGIELRAMADLVAKDAKSRASWSSRIPGSIHRQGSGLSIRVVAGGADAPNAAPLESGSKGHGGVNRHPVFAAVGSAAYGNSGRWVDQPTRPFLLPALDAHRTEIVDLLGRSTAKALDARIGRP